MVTSMVTRKPAAVALVRMSRYASWYAQNAMAQAMQVQALQRHQLLAQLCALFFGLLETLAQFAFGGYQLKH